MQLRSNTNYKPLSHDRTILKILSRLFISSEPPADITLQIVSSILTVLGVIDTITGIDCHDSMAAVLIRQLRNRRTFAHNLGESIAEKHWAWETQRLKEALWISRSLYSSFKTL
jgi:hypothetical protein